MEKHLIHRQKILLQIPKRDDAFALQSMVSYLLQNELKNSLESALDSAFPPGKVVRIDTLKLDLGDINPNNFEQEFKARFVTALTESLSAKSDSITSSSNDGESIMTEAQSIANALIFFLEKGYLPWYSSVVNITDWEANILKTLTKREYQYLTEWIKETYPQNNTVIDRLILQFSDRLLTEILQNIAPSIHYNWEHVYADFAFLLSIFDKGKSTVIPKGQKQPDNNPHFNLNSTTVRNQIWQAVFQVLLTGTGKTYAFSILKLLSADFGIKGKHITAVKEKQIISGLKTPVVKDVIEPWVQFLKVEDGSISTKTDNSAKDGDSSASDDITSNVDADELSAKNQTKDIFAEDITNDNDQKTENKADTDKKTIKKKKLNDDKDIISVNTSGIVILNPFIKIYLEKLELMAANKFVNDQARERSVMLLYYLATGKVDAAEFDLPLQKILCGYPLEQSLATTIKLSKKEKTYATELLTNVINYWEPLKNTSIAGFREAFLLRNGNLELRENGWLLKVEQKTLDILLGKLPWGFSTIRQPWMQNILSVDWY